MQLRSGPLDAPSSARVLAEAPRDTPARGPIATLFVQFAVQDWILFGYLTVFLLAVLHGSGPARSTCIEYLLFDLAVLATAFVVCRKPLVRPRLAAYIYRVSIFFGLLAPFFQLTLILPEVSSRVVDSTIFTFDMNVFHVEPALAWDRFVTPATTEWFAFFYYSYFFLLGAHTFPFAFVAKKVGPLSEFGFGVCFIFGLAHVIYMIVPGYGPYAYLADRFQHPLHGAVFWPLVEETVGAAGARKDIFPSLHTCVPTFLTLLSFRHRKSAPFKYTWPVVAFFTSQIITATMFLRWHYLIDICAGITLACIALAVSVRVSRWELERRKREGLDPLWIAPIR
jgi:PAP2 superfamily